jgi:hypothetical protein
LCFHFPIAEEFFDFLKKEFGELIEEVALPESRYFDYKLNGAEQVISFQEIFASGEGMNIKIPTNHYFNSIIEASRLITIETWMNNREEPPNYATFSNLLIFDKDEEKWYETFDPRNILDIGMLLGVVNDTLYFYEGSLMQHDEKHIKGAVLRHIEE